MSYPDFITVDSTIDTSESLIVPPACEPLDLAFVKMQRRVSTTSQDALFDLWIAAARQFWEFQTGRQQITATWDYALDAAPCVREIELPRPPLQSVVGVFVLNTDGTETEFDAANYRVVAPSGYLSKRGRIVLVEGASWPTTIGEPKSLRVRFLAGYGNAMGAVPELERHVLLTLVGHFHRYGEAVQQPEGNSLIELPFGASTILKQSMYASVQTLIPRRTA